MNAKILFGITALLLVAFIGFIVADSGSRVSRAFEGTAAVADCGSAGCAAYGIDENAGGSNAGAGSNNAGNAGTGAGAQGGAGSGAGDANAGAAVQSVSLRATPSGYDKATITVKAGVPVNFEFSADPRSGCGRQLIIDNVGVNLVSQSGEKVSATFTPPTPGRYAYHCGMNMFRGTLIAT